MTTAGYLRVSTKMQDAQRQKNELNEAYEVDQWFGDTGSGSSTEREGYMNMMDSLGDIDKVVCHEASRLTRNLKDLIEILERFEEYSVEFETLGVMPDFDPENAMSKAFIQVVMAVQEIEREQIRERVQSGVNQAQEQGKWVGRVPFGYTTNPKGYLVKDEVEFGLLRDAISDLMTGKSQAQVARDYEPLTQSTLSKILRRIEDGDEMYQELGFDRKEWKVNKHNLGDAD